MSTSVDQCRDPLVGNPADPALAELRAAFLQARVRDTTVRLSLAMFRARGYAQVWGRDEDARRWTQAAEELRAELETLHEELAVAGATPSDDELAAPARTRSDEELAALV